MVGRVGSGSLSKPRSSGSKALRNSPAYFRLLEMYSAIACVVELNSSFALLTSYMLSPRASMLPLNDGLLRRLFPFLLRRLLASELVGASGNASEDSDIALCSKC